MGVLFGTTQGRLVRSATGDLQCFPQDDWPRELDLAREIGLDYVEWVVERRHNANNPIWSDAGLEEIGREMDRAGLVRHSAINDYLVEAPLDRSEEGLEQTLRFVDRAARLGLRKVILPLLEASDPAGRPRRPLVAALRAVAESAASKHVLVCLETVLPGGELLDLIEGVDRPNLRICFDTGNRAALGQDIYGDLRLLGPAVAHMHIKDKNQSGANVLLGAGLVNLHRVCEALAAIGYSNAYTFETTRGTDPLATARGHLAMLVTALAEAGAPGRAASQPS